jgi:phosphoserine aminotransferase
MITFNPGPSQITPVIQDFLQHLPMGNFLSLSHRSPEFIDFFDGLIRRMKRVFAVPEDYRIFFVPSATAAMSMIVGNLVTSHSTHFVHGSFSERFAETSSRMGKNICRFDSDPDKPVRWEEREVPGESEMIAVTHNETSTGLMWPGSDLEALRKRWPDPILAVDVTSSFGAVPFQFHCADIWFASVQKVLGLPAGLGFMIVSPRAMEKSESMTRKELPAWMDLTRLDTLYRKPQTFETPSAIHLAMLNRVLEDWNVQDVFSSTVKKAERLYSVLIQEPMSAVPFVKSPHWRSTTVACFEVENPAHWHELALAEGFVLGKGYGTWKTSQVRIANFPAHTATHFQMLFQILRKNI